ncbi:hypothetical protein [Solidesulfovibrio sp.]
MPYGWRSFLLACGAIAALAGGASAQLDDSAKKALQALDEAQVQAEPAKAPSREKAGEDLAIEAGNPASGRYYNAKYRYRIAYPEAVFTPQGESDAGDGQRFLAAGGRARLLVYGAFNALGTTLDQEYREALGQAGRTVTYQVLRKDWFVVSGLARDDIFYRKTILADDIFRTVELTYPRALKATFDPLVAGIVQSFRPD